MAVALSGVVAPGVYRRVCKGGPRYCAMVRRVFDTPEEAIAWREPLVNPLTKRPPAKRVWLSFTRNFVRQMDDLRGVELRPDFIRKHLRPVPLRDVPLDRAHRRSRHEMMLSSQLIAEIDAVRGKHPRGRYIEALLTPIFARLTGSLAVPS